MVTEYGPDASEQANAIASRINQVHEGKFKLPWNVLYTSHEPEKRFAALLFEHANLFDAFVKMPNTGGYTFPYSYKPAKVAKTHVANENFNPDFFLKVSSQYDILVVEIKTEGDDSNRNRAKCRDGLTHFETLNERLKESGEPWRYHFYFLSPEDYTRFFENIRNNTFPVSKAIDFLRRCIGILDAPELEHRSIFFFKFHHDGVIGTAGLPRHHK
jgi:type III restriction enzyme